jgi:hypothetical protein
MSIGPRKYKVQGFEWTFFFAAETDKRPGPTYISQIHNWWVTVYVSQNDRKWHFSIEGKHGLLYRSSLDPAYVPSDDPYEIIHTAEQRLLKTIAA